MFNMYLFGWYLSMGSIGVKHVTYQKQHLTFFFSMSGMNPIFLSITSSLKWEADFTAVDLPVGGTLFLWVRFQNLTSQCNTWLWGALGTIIQMVSVCAVPCHYLQALCSYSIVMHIEHCVHSIAHSPIHATFWESSSIWIIWSHSAP